MPSTISLGMRSVSNKHSIRAFVSESESERIYDLNTPEFQDPNFEEYLRADILRTEWDGH